MVHDVVHVPRYPCDGDDVASGGGVPLRAAAAATAVFAERAVAAAAEAA
eukprot:CAMPEP_0177191258 /NCGR_PEP_ID=MMETSP0367-20130122/21259_1 /TAXON_ID=447022 ORGANISM="Scrippsiella hangoei-like, Strain SHHI-4" /NCGR_SAMPLE_ID=MMETSP0367 /ASSEMBLY_ACC=CAM_ASM_000362 /LENGTH=48 /DNA_ID= /DNA_START= /DNA_END= /DNA_ORIENTATION=